VRIGWYYLCPDCGHFHLNAAGGYAISADGIVATCYHCVDPGDAKGEGYLVAADSTGAVLPVTTVIAANRVLDCALVRVAGGTLTPLALNPDVATGDPAYLYSDPLDTRGYFSAGIVNRFYWQNTKGANPATLAGILRLRLNVSTDWAPGSSGAAVLDAFGNVIGHVSMISALHEAPGKAPPKRANDDNKDESDKHAKGIRSDPLITLHEAIPARGVLLLAKSMDPQAAKP
jgi:S1-C subfamily serine protease